MGSCSATAHQNSPGSNRIHACSGRVCSKYASRRVGHDSDRFYEMTIRSTSGSEVGGSSPYQAMEARPPSLRHRLRRPAHRSTAVTTHPRVTPLAVQTRPTNHPSSEPLSADVAVNYCRQPPQKPRQEAPDGASNLLQLSSKMVAESGRVHRLGRLPKYGLTTLANLDWIARRVRMLDSSLNPVVVVHSYPEPARSLTKTISTASNTRAQSTGAIGTLSPSSARNLPHWSSRSCTPSNPMPTASSSPHRAGPPHSSSARRSQASSSAVSRSLAATGVSGISSTHPSNRQSSSDLGGR